MKHWREVLVIGALAFSLFFLYKGVDSFVPVGTSKGPTKQFKSVSIYSPNVDGDLDQFCQQANIDLYITKDTVLFKSEGFNIGYDPFVVLDSSFIVVDGHGLPVEMFTRNAEGEEILYFVENDALVILSTGTECIEAE